jgi:hypothetical protein
LQSLFLTIGVLNRSFLLIEHMHASTWGFNSACAHTWPEYCVNQGEQDKKQGTTTCFAVLTGEHLLTACGKLHCSLVKCLFPVRAHAEGIVKTSFFVLDPDAQEDGAMLGNTHCIHNFLVSDSFCAVSCRVLYDQRCHEQSQVSDSSPSRYANLA